MKFSKFLAGATMALAASAALAASPASHAPERKSAASAATQANALINAAQQIHGAISIAKADAATGEPPVRKWGDLIVLNYLSGIPAELSLSAEKAVTPLITQVVSKPVCEELNKRAGLQGMTVLDPERTPAVYACVTQTRTFFYKL